MAEYETQVAFYQRYNYGATADIRKELVDQMNKILDDLYENRYDELYHQNAYREVTGRQVSMPTSELPDGAKLYAKQILKDPEKYFTEDVMNKLDEAAKKEFSYGGGVKELESEEIETGEADG